MRRGSAALLVALAVAGCSDDKAGAPRGADKATEATRRAAAKGEEVLRTGVEAVERSGALDKAQAAAEAARARVAGAQSELEAKLATVEAELDEARGVAVSATLESLAIGLEVARRQAGNAERLGGVVAARRADFERAAEAATAALAEARRAAEAKAPDFAAVLEQAKARIEAAARAAESLR